MQLDIVVAFFILGAFAKLSKANFEVPQAIYRGCTLFLLLAIGIKGGIAFTAYPLGVILPQATIVILFGFLLPFVAHPVLRYVGGWNTKDAASTAAHYGSVSVATYAVAVAVLESQDIEYEAYFPLFVALLEIPAILAGLLIAKPDVFKSGNFKKTGHEMFFNEGVLLLIGGLIIGIWGGERTDRLMPFFGDLFHGVLALFLLELGRQAASRINDIKREGPFLATFSIFMPLVGAGIAFLVATELLNLNAGGTFLFMVLGSSASYIAVPAAMRSALPEANNALAITASLAITFPFNVLVAIPLYLNLTQIWS
jgi:hypothetical protein